MRRTPDEALQQLREAHADALSTYCLRLTGSPQDADAAVDETWAAASERVGSGRAPRDPQTSLFADARAACLRQVADAGPADGEEEELLAGEAEDDVLAAAQRLPLRYRELLVLRDLQRMPIRQIAAITERSPHVSAHLAWRARAVLQAALPGGMAVSAVAPTPDCESVLTLSELHQDSALAPAEERWRSAHLRRCPHCEGGRAAIAGAADRYRRAGAHAPLRTTAVAAPVLVAAAAPAVAAAAPRPVAPAPAPERPEPDPRRRRLAGALLATVLALALGAGVLVSAGDDSAPSSRDEPAARGATPAPREAGAPPPERDATPAERRRSRRADRDRERDVRASAAAAARPRASRQAAGRERTRRRRPRERSRSRRPASGDRTRPAPAPASSAPAPAPSPAPSGAAPAAAPAPAPAPAPPAPAPAQPAAAPPPSQEGPPCKDKDKPDKGNGGGRPDC